MTRLDKRLAGRAALAPVGCATCRHWSELVLGDDQGNRSRPDRCPGCSRLVPIRHLVVIVGVPLDAV